MIRINLLPQKRRPERAPGGQLWLVGLLVLLALELGGLIVVYGLKREQLQAQNERNQSLSNQIEADRRAVQGHEALKAKLQKLRAREEAIGKLQSGRSGPAALLLELARITTPGRGPSVDPATLEQVRRTNPLALFSPDWDARRLWLTSLVEDQRRIKLQGVARDGEDVSELARRMSLSRFFSEVRLLPGRKERDPKLGLELVRFELEAMVRY